MKALCISCFNYYDTRIKGVISFFKNKGIKVGYIISDFSHFSKKYYKVDYKNTKQIHVIPYRTNISLLRLISHYMFSKRVAKEIRKYKPDLIYCIIPPNSLVREIERYKRKKHDVKIVFDIYDMWPESFPYKSNSRILNFLLSKWGGIRDKYIGCANEIITVSQKAKENLDSIYEMKAKILLPSNFEVCSPQYRFCLKNELVFLYLGGINHITDIELGTELLKKLVKYRKVTLHIIGEGQKRELWISMLEKSGVKVVSHGVIFDSDKKRKIIELCNFGLNIPQKEIGSTMALKVIEYMRFGLPFINSGLGDNEKMVADYKIGLNVQDGNVEKKILEFTDKDLKEMSRNCINLYKDKFLKQDYDEIFSDVL